LSCYKICIKNIAHRITSRFESKIAFFAKKILNQDLCQDPRTQLNKHKIGELSSFDIILYELGLVLGLRGQLHNYSYILVDRGRVNREKSKLTSLQYLLQLDQKEGHK